jgi:hypothetical protein
MQLTRLMLICCRTAVTSMGMLRALRCNFNGPRGLVAPQAAATYVTSSRRAQAVMVVQGTHVGKLGHVIVAACDV